MASTEDRQLAQILAETVSELRLLRRELAAAVEALPLARPPEPQSAPSPQTAGTATAGRGRRRWHPRTTRPSCRA